MAPLGHEKKVLSSTKTAKLDMLSSLPMESDAEIDLREVYFLIMHFLSSGPCKRTYGQLCNELLEHQLLPRRYHAWYSRNSKRIGDEDDDGVSLPLSYLNLIERYPHVEKDHLVKLLKKLLVNCSMNSIVGGHSPNASDVPTLLGSGAFSLLASKDREDQRPIHMPSYLRWPHMHADQVRGLALREMGGGFMKHHRAPSVRAACYAIAKPSTIVEKMQIIKKLRGHQNSVYCATFDRLGLFVITGSDDRLVKIWSMDTAFCLASCRGHEGDITDLAVSSNNALVASSSNDFIIRVWRLADGLPISVLKGHTCTVTAIAFSPRPSSGYQLLSSSDDGTCRIWDARHSQSIPKVYVPKPQNAVDGKGGEPGTSSGQQGHRISCCAFNANGTVFVAGSSDTYARVWTVYKNNSEDPEQPNYEMDLLSGHENEVNYVQFSGCSVACKTSTSDAFKEDNLPKSKFKKSWFAHDNIVTCSRDGSAIIWIPRSRRSHGKVGRWTRAYHLKVPPPPVPPQPPRGGPRQRFQVAPRGVNMIVWSLDNRFVLAAITDCRICVWNASDGSLVHSLIGHSESTFVLDVHPFNPRIAMSAGYDGKTIIWDIWEGTPVRIYETGRFKLVDGKFSPDGTSIILSDEVGQIFIIATGQGESQKDAKYDQFFLGDYRPLIPDAYGNILDQETQLVPYRRNMQDLLCDSSMIPYPEPYQSMFQKRRLGNLGIEWRPSSVKFATGPTYNVNSGEFQLLPIIDLERLGEPFPEFVDAIEWEPEVEIQSDDTDSEYNVTDECSSEGDHASCSSVHSDDLDGSAEDIGFDNASREDLSRSRRKPPKPEVEITTSSGRRVKRRNLDDHETVILRARSTRKSKNGRVASRGKASASKSSRPLRRAARNALHSFSKINEVSTLDEEESCGTSSESETELPDSDTESNESEDSMGKGKIKEEKDDVFLEEFETPAKLTSMENTGRRRLVLKLPLRESKVVLLSEETRSEVKEESAVIVSSHENGAVAGTNSVRRSGSGHVDSTPHSGETSGNALVVNGDASKQSPHSPIPHLPSVRVSCNNTSIKWGEVKTRTSKRLKSDDSSALDASPASNALEYPNEFASNCNGNTTLECNDRMSSGSEGTSDENPRERRKAHLEGRYSVLQNGGSKKVASWTENGKINETEHSLDGKVHETRSSPLDSSSDLNHESGKVSLPPYRKIKITSRGLVKELVTSSSSLRPALVECPESAKPETMVSQDLASPCHGEDVNAREHSLKLETRENNDTRNLNSHASKGKNLEPRAKSFTAVYTRSKPSRGRKNSDVDVVEIEENASTPNDYDTSLKDFDGSLGDNGARRTRSMGVRAADDEGTSRMGTRSSLRGRDNSLADGLKAMSSMVSLGLRSTRSRRENNSASDPRSLDKRKYHQTKVSWLMLLEHEDAYRYIPQQGDDVVYLRQGHEEYVNKTTNLHEAVPLRFAKGSLKAVEFCRIHDLNYSYLPGSGESCCKLTLEFTNPSSSGFGKFFKLTLPELLSIPDFIVERSRYDASIERNWTRRDKPLVWWRNEDGGGGTWWEGRVVNVHPRSLDFPESPWERYEIQYKAESSDSYYHSPWELHEAESPWVHPQIDGGIRKLLLTSLEKLELISVRNQDKHGIRILNQASFKSDFLNRFPVPLSPESIKSRLTNNYYRSLEAVKHDSRVMLSNAESYFGESAEMMLKMRRLSEWFAETFLSL